VAQKLQRLSLDPFAATQPPQLYGIWGVPGKGGALDHGRCFPHQCRVKNGTRVWCGSGSGPWRQWWWGAGGWECHVVGAANRITIPVSRLFAQELAQSLSEPPHGLPESGRSVPAAAGRACRGADRGARWRWRPPSRQRWAGRPWGLPSDSAIVVHSGDPAAENPTLRPGSP